MPSIPVVAFCLDKLSLPKKCWRITRCASAFSCEDLKQAAREVADGPPHGGEAYYYHRGEHQRHVGGLDADRVGVDNEAAL